jgi:MarR family transcriptional regulator, organic hydroperoxide resistance regulator
VGTKRDCLVEEALSEQQRVARCLRSAATSTWLQLDLTIAQVKGLFYLAAARQSTVGELARALGVGQPASSALVERLVQVGLVRRGEDPADRRRAIVQLAREGEELVEQLEQAGRERWRHWLRQLSREDLAALLQGLRALGDLTEADADCACFGGSFTSPSRSGAELDAVDGPESARSLGAAPDLPLDSVASAADGDR